MGERIKPEREVIEVVGDGITRLCLEAPEWSFGAPNWYLVKGENGIAVIDTGQGLSKETDLFKKAWGSMGKPPVDAVILTHYHFDHSGGAEAISELTGTQRVIGGDEKKVEAQEVDLGGRKLTIIPTPGHTADSLCVLDDKTGILFTGDTLIEGMDSVVVTDMSEYVKSLKLLQQMEPNKILSGHGLPIDNTFEKIEKYIERTYQRESVVMSFVGRGYDTVDSLHARMYPDKTGSGRVQIVSHIDKLIKDGRLKEVDGRLELSV
jgi:glyoxylase-like metal-dependent hydrolase (beta-lactamase superfamily II)